MVEQGMVKLARGKEATHGSSAAEQWCMMQQPTNTRLKNSKGSKGEARGSRSNEEEQQHTAITKQQQRRGTAKEARGKQAVHQSKDRGSTATTLADKQ